MCVKSIFVVVLGVSVLVLGASSIKSIVIVSWVIRVRKREGGGRRMVGGGGRRREGGGRRRVGGGGRKRVGGGGGRRRVGRGGMRRG